PPFVGASRPAAPIIGAARAWPSGVVHPAEPVHPTRAMLAPTTGRRQQIAPLALDRLSWIATIGTTVRAARLSRSRTPLTRSAPPLVSATLRREAQHDSRLPRVQREALISRVVRRHTDGDRPRHHRGPDRPGAPPARRLRSLPGRVHPHPAPADQPPVGEDVDPRGVDPGRPAGTRTPVRALPALRPLPLPDDRRQRRASHYPRARRHASRRRPEPDGRYGPAGPCRRPLRDLAA